MKPPQKPRAVARTLLLVAACAGGAASDEAEGRQLCRFPDGERRVVYQPLGSVFGLSVTDCQPLPAVALPVSREAPFVAYAVAEHEAEAEVEVRVITAAPSGRLRAAPSADATVVPAAYQQLIARSARSHGVDPQIVEAVMYVESRFSPNAQSGKGALGLMQLMPQTAQQYGVQSRARLLDPATNIECGVRYLSELTETFAGRLDLAIAAYNAGPGAVIRHGWRVPPFAETQDYVRQVLQRIKGARFSSTGSPGSR